MKTIALILTSVALASCGVTLQVAPDGSVSGSYTPPAPEIKAAK